MKSKLPLIALALLTHPAAAEVVTKTIDYRDGDVALQGFLAYDDAKARAGAPGVLIVHQWMGLSDNEKRRARMLARMGYVAFALDIYGKDDRPANRGEAGKYAGKYKSNRALYRQRLSAGLAELRKQTPGSKERVAAIGYCFGGTGVLELVRSGADVAGVVSFHGGLDSPSPADGKNIRAKILICHGADDPFVPAKDIDAMVKELNGAKVDWQMISYAGAVHAFTQKEAGDDKSRGAAYDEKADRRSWGHMRQFFFELFPAGGKKQK